MVCESLMTGEDHVSVWMCFSDSYQYDDVLVDGWGPYVHTTITTYCTCNLVLLTYSTVYLKEKLLPEMSNL